MSKHDDDGGPAYPHYTPEGGAYIESACDGMTLLDWFAGQASVSEKDMQCARQVEHQVMLNDSAKTYSERKLEVDAAMEAEIRYRKAEAMIAEKRRMEMNNG